MTDIEQLRAAIATLEAAKKDIDRISATYFPPGYWREITEHAITTELKERLARLETEEAEEADPWKTAKNAVAALVDFLRSTDSVDTTWTSVTTHTACEIAYFVRHLEQRVAELQAQLAKRPVVWCNRLPTGECLRDVSGHVKVYTNKEKEDCFLVRGRFEPYTGEQE